MAALIAVVVAPPPSSALADNIDSSTISEEITSVLEEVIVTARKRQETLQNIPVAVSALTADALQKAGVSNTRDLERTIPGLVFNEGNAKAPSIYIRGIGQKESAALFDPSVGVYINGVYITRTDSQLLDTVDTQSVQVLRGPQGTLFGKNSTGGAMLITTVEPNLEDFSTTVSTRIGNFGRKDLKLSMNIPFDDDSRALRFSLNSTKLKGYLTNAYDNNQYADEERLGATARLFWQIDDIFSSDLFYYWSKTNERGSGATCIFQNGNSAFSRLSWPQHSYPDAYKKRCLRSEELAKNRKILMNDPSKFRITNNITALTLSWEYDDYEVKSITSWSHQSDINVSDDIDATDITGVAMGTVALVDTLETSLAYGYGNFQIPSDEKRDQYGQEIQLIGSALDERLSFTTGIFVTVETLDDNVFAQLIGDRGYSVTSTEIGGTTLPTLVPKLMGVLSDMNNNTYAIFGQTTLDVTDWYQFTFGLRYTYEKREREASLYEAACSAIVEDELVGDATDVCLTLQLMFLADPEVFYGNPPSVLPIQSVEEYITIDGRTIVTNNGRVKSDKSWNSLTPTITNSFIIGETYLEESMLDSALLYITYSEGFKAGGFDMKGLEMVMFDREEITNWEIGFKFDAYDHRLRLNTALYRMDYKDIQVRIAEQGRSIADVILYVDNAGRAKIQGLELELTAIPVTNLTLLATASYTDASYDKFDAIFLDLSLVPPTQTMADRSDEDFVGVPELSYSLTLMYDWYTGLGSLSPSLSLFYRDEQYTGLDAAAWYPEFRDRSYFNAVTLWNLRVSFTPSALANSNVTLFINNLTDEDYFQGGFSQTVNLGASVQVKGMPRVYGFEASISF